MCFEHSIYQKLNLRLSLQQVYFEDNGCLLWMDFQCRVNTILSHTSQYMYVSSGSGCGYTGMVCAISTTNLSVCKKAIMNSIINFILKLLVS